MSVLFLLQVLYKVYISFVEVGPGNVMTSDYFKGVGEYAPISYISRATYSKYIYITFTSSHLSDRKSVV